MPAIRLIRDIALLTLRAEISHSHLACTHDTQAVDLAEPFKVLLDDWHIILAKQLVLWDAQASAELQVTRADDNLGLHIDAFAGVLKVVVEFNLENPLYRFYIKTDVTTLKRPVLGTELATVRSWLPSLAAAKAADSPLGDFHDIFALDVKRADEAVQAVLAANKTNEEFRTIGELSAFFDKVEAARDLAFTELDARRLEKPESKLPRTWAASFFRSRPRPALTSEAKATRAAEREAAGKARRELEEKKRAARAKIKEAEKELAALKA